jgi:glycosyltransferase involved in cell wall biosynthesis
MLTILSVAYPFAPVGPDAVGGAEQVLSHLDQALTLAGHRSIVAACEGSRVSGTLCATPLPRGPITPELRRAVHRAHYETICRAVEQSPVHLVHMHGIDFHEYLPPNDVRVLVTLHLPLEWYSHELRDLRRPNLWMHGVSASQHSKSSFRLPLLPQIENGVSELFFEVRHARRNFALCLGRVCPEKGFHLALEASARARVPCLIGGQVFPYPEHHAYFEREICPRLGCGARFLGPLELRRKRRFLAAARCLLVPSLVDETSSLVAMEALACGTPVIAFATGALPDIIDHGSTGFIVRDVSEMADAIRSAAAIDRDACRAVARARFAVEGTIAKYFQLYEQLAGRTLPVLTNTGAPSPTACAHPR